MFERHDGDKIWLGKWLLNFFHVNEEKEWSWSVIFSDTANTWLTLLKVLVDEKGTRKDKEVLSWGYPTSNKELSLGYEGSSFG